MIGGWKKENWKIGLWILSHLLFWKPPNSFIGIPNTWDYIVKVKEIAMSKIVYGLKLRLPSQQKKNQQQLQQSSKPPHPPAFRFNDNDDDVESDISRQASKNKSLKDIEEQQKKALEEDPTVFDVESDIKTRAQLRSLFV